MANLPLGNPIEPASWDSLDVPTPWILEHVKSKGKLSSDCSAILVGLHNRNERIPGIVLAASPTFSKVSAEAFLSVAGYSNIDIEAAVSAKVGHYITLRSHVAFPVFGGFARASCS